MYTITWKCCTPSAGRLDPLPIRTPVLAPQKLFPYQCFRISPSNFLLRNRPTRIGRIFIQARSQNEKSSNQTSDHSQPRRLNQEDLLDQFAHRLLKFAKANFLPLALIIGVAIGLIYPAPGCLAQKYSMAKFSTFGLFLVSGLTLKTDEIFAAIDAWPIGGFGLASILLFTPFLSKLVIQIAITPKELVKGLAIFCCMPTTLSSGIALTQLAGGNSALAILLTVSSNLLGIVTVPFMLSNLVARGVGVSLPTKQLLKSLAMTLLLPLLLGKGLRSAHKGIAEFVDKRRMTFSILNSILLSLVPWMQVSGSKELLLSMSPRTFLFSIIIGICIHIVLLAWNTVMTWSLSVISDGQSTIFGNKRNVRATILVASQKTLPVMIAILGQLGNIFGDSGILIIPCVAAHINQIIIDSFIVNFWIQKDQSSLSKQC